MENPEPLTAIVVTGSQYPGNLGTIMRTAALLGIKWVAVLGGLPGGNKTVGQVFRSAQLNRDEQWDVHLVVADDDLSVGNAFVELRNLGMKLVGLTDAIDAVPVWDVDLTQTRMALVFGKETGGIPHEAERQLDILATIPQLSEGNLNVAQAAAMVTYERHRQLQRVVVAPQSQPLFKKARTV